MGRFDKTGHLLARGCRCHDPLQECGELREPLGGMGDSTGCLPLALLVDDDDVVMVVGPVDAGVPHGWPPPLRSLDEGIPGAYKPYTAVLEARPSIRGGTQE